MNAVEQVKKAVVKAVRSTDVAAIGAYDAERLKKYETAVVAVGVRETRIEQTGAPEYLGRRTEEETQTTREVYGRKLLLTLSLDVYAPRALGAEGCAGAAGSVTQALTAALPEGLRLRGLRWGETEWDKTYGMFRLCALAEYAAYFTAEAEEDGTVFTDFLLKGVVRENESNDP